MARETRKLHRSWYIQRDKDADNSDNMRSLAMVMKLNEFYARDKFEFLIYIYVMDNRLLLLVFTFRELIFYQF